EEPGDRHLRRRRLRQDRRRQHGNGGEGEDCDDEELPHYRLLSCGEQPSNRSVPPPPTSPTVARRTAGSGHLVSQGRSKVKEKLPFLGLLAPVAEIFQLGRRRLAKR